MPFNINMIPHTVFIIPYRNRAKHKETMDRYLKQVFESKKWTSESVDIIYCHQQDTRPFNRGATKNIGFLYIKNKYPDDYKNITFIFHDIDTYASNPSILPYKTNNNIVSHYYGFRFCLGGIFCIKGGDFERTGGFPNLWGWGFEDNIINTRCLENNITIDRSHFYNIGDKSIIRVFDGYLRKMSKRELTDRDNKRETDTFSDIENIEMTRNNEMLDISYFTTKHEYFEDEFCNYDIRNGTKLGKQINDL